MDANEKKIEALVNVHAKAWEFIHAYSDSTPKTSDEWPGEVRALLEALRDSGDRSEFVLARANA